MSPDRRPTTPRQRPTAGSRPAARTGRGRTSRTTASRGTSRPAVRTAAEGGGQTPPRIRRPQSMRRMVTLGLIVVFLSVLIIPTLRNYLQQRSEINALNKEVASQQQTVTALQREKDRWNNPAYVQQQARERLGFAKPGEKAYIVIDDRGQKHQTSPQTGVPTDTKHAGRPWYGQLWESVVIAGKSKPAQ